MLKRTAALLAAAAATIAAALTLTPGTTTAAPRPDTNVTLASTIALDDCSASLVRYPTSQDTDQALMLTAGHCYEGGMPSTNQVLQNVPSTRSGTLLDATGDQLGTVQADKLLYATMTNTDIALYELTDTYTSLTTQYGTTALTLSPTHPTNGDTITIPSAYWDRTWNCTLNGFAPTVEEDQWTWHDSLRYSPTGCNIIGGTSGSPVVDASTDQVVGVNNTINEDGQMCTLNNPCEVAPDGTTTETQGQGYGQEAYWITTCLDPSNAIELTTTGCLLPTP